jgi:hypothetical protein
LISFLCVGSLKEERRLRVFENSVLRRILGLRGDVVTREWRKLHNEELNDLYCSPNVIRKGHVARVGERRVVYRVLGGGNLKERDHGPGVNRRIILIWIFRKWDVGVWNESSWLRIGTGGGHL